MTCVSSPESLASHRELSHAASALSETGTSDHDLGFSGYTQNYAHREAARSEAARDDAWQRDMIAAGRLFISSQTSSIMRHLAPLHAAAAAGSAAAFQPHGGNGGSGSGVSQTIAAAGAPQQQRGTYVLLAHEVSQLQPSSGGAADTMPERSDW